jgi:CheY-like chemotaxis protein
VEEARAIDMVFLDNSMPVMGGPEACRAMRALGSAGPSSDSRGTCWRKTPASSWPQGPIT